MAPNSQLVQAQISNARRILMGSVVEELLHSRPLPLLYLCSLPPLVSESCPIHHLVDVV